MAILAIDLGGTNIRFGIAPDETAPIADIKVMACADFPTIEDAINAYLSSHQSHNIEAVSIAVAAPVMDDIIDITNNNWRFSKTALHQNLGIKRLLVINDFTAQALAQHQPNRHGNIVLKQGRNHDQGQPDAPLLVIGPGTGLGVAALKPTSQGMMPIEGEGGHVYFTPRNDRERQLEEYLRGEVGFVSAEHIISGSGLEAIYRFLCQHDNAPYDGKSAAEIGDAALTSDGRERQAVFLLMEALATVMVNSIITLGCWQGAVIAGGIIPRFISIIEESGFLNRFQDAGVLTPTIQDLPIWLATDPYLGLEGARDALTNPYLSAQVMHAS